MILNKTQVARHIPHYYKTYPKTTAINSVRLQSYTEIQINGPELNFDKSHRTVQWSTFLSKYGMKDWMNLDFFLMLHNHSLQIEHKPKHNERSYKIHEIRVLPDGTGKQRTKVTRAGSMDALLPNTGQPPWKAVWHFLKILKMELPHGWTILFLNAYQEQ